MQEAFNEPKTTPAKKKRLSQKRRVSKAPLPPMPKEQDPIVDLDQELQEALTGSIEQQFAVEARDATGKASKSRESVKTSVLAMRAQLHEDNASAAQALADIADEIKTLEDRAAVLNRDIAINESSMAALEAALQKLKAAV